MNLSTLSEYLQRLNLNPAAYSLDPTPLSEGDVLERTSHGWEVSFRERGQSTKVAEYHVVDDACWELFRRIVQSLLLSDQLRAGHRRHDIGTVQAVLRNSRLMRESDSPVNYVTPQQMNLENLALLLDRLGVSRNRLALGREDPSAQYSVWESPYGWAIASRMSGDAGIRECRYFGTESDACWSLARWIIEGADAPGQAC